MPTSVLLAVLAAAGLLALAPALVRRYDATERLAAERAQSTARVLDRARRRRTVPGARPINAPREAEPAAGSQTGSSAGSAHAGLRSDDAATGPGLESGSAGAVPAVSGPAGSAAGSAADQARPDSTPAVGRAVWVPIGRFRVGAGARPAKPGQRSRSATARRDDPARAEAQRSRRSEPRHRQSKVVYRRRRALAGLVLLNAVELTCVGTVSTVVWPAAAVTGVVLAVYLVHLRNAAIEDARRRRLEARRAAYVARVQAEIRAEQARRLAARRESLRRAAAARAAAQRDAQRLSQRYVDFDPARRARVRGRQYDTGHAAGL